MHIREVTSVIICLIVLLSSVIILITNPVPVNAIQNKLMWTIIDTPSDENNVVPLERTEVNFIAVGSDDLTIYAVDIANADATDGSKALYKSVDNGFTWTDEPSKNLFTAMVENGDAANFRIWNIAIAPDNVNVIAVVTGKSGDDSPKQVYISTDGGDNWSKPSLALINATEKISCIGISPLYGNNQRDFAIGTRTAYDVISIADGAVYILKTPGTSGFASQSDPTKNWTPRDVIALKFSPAYDSDSGLATIISTWDLSVGATYLDQGERDLAAANIENTVEWKTVTLNSNLVELTNGSSNTSPDASKIRSACIELPSDFSCANTNLQRYYISYDDNYITERAGIYRIDHNIIYRLFASNDDTRISSIAYFGTFAGGILLAGQVEADSIKGIADLWKTTDPATSTVPPVWTKSQKPPTGGAKQATLGFYFANMQIAWNPSGNLVYCGTSSADLVDRGDPDTGWPNGYLKSVQYDESAFSVSPYSNYYEEKITKYEKEIDSEIGDIWNQMGLIDTKITLLSDVASLEVPVDSLIDYSILYLATVNEDPSPDFNFDSVWRCIPDDEFANKWERIATVDTPNDDLILRVFQDNSYLASNTRSNVLVYADRRSPDIGYSANEGQAWQKLLPFTDANDLALENDNTIFVLDSATIRKGKKEGDSWSWAAPISTGLTSAYSIYVLPEGSQGFINGKKSDEWVAIGDETLGVVAYCDYSGAFPKYSSSPRFESTPPLPTGNKIHVFLHHDFLSNRMLFAATVDPGDDTGKIYRWVIGQNSDVWTELKPPNEAFYGIVITKDVLYGAWNNSGTSGIEPGVDRTLYASQTIPPLPEWDDLTYNLPSSPSVQFTREPSALKVSIGDFNTLWAIDNRDFNLSTKTGCLWAYTDTLAIRGPFPSAPALGGTTKFDSVSGRAGQINFQWFQLVNAGIYEFILAKDEAFTLPVIHVPSIIPCKQNAPSWILPSGSVLEEGHKYFWKVRATGGVSRAPVEDNQTECDHTAEDITEMIHSPWSTTMNFTVMKGLAVETKYQGVTLLAPVDSCGCPCDKPFNFSWSPYPYTTKYLFQLSDKPDMGSPLISKELEGTAYNYQGNLKCGNNYFWRVKAIYPFPSEWSATFTFKTQQADDPQETVIEHKKSGQEVPVKYILIITALGSLTGIGIIVLIIMTRREQ